MDTARIESTSPLLPNDIEVKLATGFKANHKTKDKPQTLLSFVHQTPNQNKAKWTLPVLKGMSRSREFH